MSDDCPCVNCNPTPCSDCGMASPGGIHLNRSGRCKHRRACEARQMMKAGEEVGKAVAHAQGLDRDAGGVADELEEPFDRVEEACDQWPFDDDPPDPL